MPPHKLTRESVVAAAMDLADRGGITALTMRSLAKHVGVEAMSLYHHLPNKEALLDAMVDRVYDSLGRVVGAFDRRIESLPPPPPARLPAASKHPK